MRRSAQQDMVEPPRGSEAAGGRERGQLQSTRKRQALDYIEHDAPSTNA